MTISDIQIPENYLEVHNYEYPAIPDEPSQFLPDGILLTSAPPLCESTPIEVGAEEILHNVEPADPPPPIPEQSSTVPELDADIRFALGDPIEDSPQYGANIHNDLAQRWLPILKKGLAKDIREKLSKEHHVPDNCRLLKAPGLNPEIAAAITEGLRLKDKKRQEKQNQLGLGITAISRAMDIVINDGNKIDIIKLLSEGCRILADLHYSETLFRTKSITPCLDKSILNIIQDEERDDLLFGSKLSEKIKAAKAIEKQGWQIKRNLPQRVNQNQIQQKVTHTGNWTPPPRYHPSSSRGGRGAYTASRGHISRQFRPQAPPLPSPAQAQPRRATVPKQRAQTRQ